MDLATGEKVDPTQLAVFYDHAVALGRLAGMKGGKARAKKLSKAQRMKIAKAGAKARWGNKGRSSNIVSHHFFRGPLWAELQGVRPVLKIRKEILQHPFSF